MKLCKFQNSAVCCSLIYRKLFESLLKMKNPDVYICPYARYKVRNRKGNYFIIDDLYFIHEKRGKYWVTDVFTSAELVLSKDNFKIICCSDKEVCPEPYVLEFNPKRES